MGWQSWVSLGDRQPQSLLPRPFPTAASLSPRPWSFDSLAVISHHRMGTLHLPPELLQRSPDYGINFTCCRHRDPCPLGSIPAITLFPIFEARLPWLLL